MRPGIDDNAELNRLLALWSSTRADLEAQLNATVAEIVDLTRSGLNPVRRRRLRVLARDLSNQRDVALAMVDGLAQSTEAWLGQPNLARIYIAGASKVAGFRFTATHQAAVDVIAQDLMGRALGRTPFVEAQAKAWTRRVSRQIVGYQATQGIPAAAASRRFIASMEREFTARGIAGVVYRNGSRHSFMEYGEMLIRTQSAKAYNVGTLNAGYVAGIEWYELADGAECGLTGHKSTPLANGLIVDSLTALDWYLSHPNCRRAILPRPDVTSGNRGAATSLQDPEAAADQASFERVLAANTARLRPRRFVSTP